MFGFGKKKEKVDKEEKERKKKDKKDKKGHSEPGRLTHEDLSRLDEIRSSLRIGKQDKALSGIVADYRVSNDSQSDAGSISVDGSHPNLAAPSRPSLLHGLTHTPPFLHPKKFPKRGILKSHRYDVSRSVSSDLDDASVVFKNTVDNEYANVYRRSAVNPQGIASPLSPVSGTSLSSESPETADREIPFVVAHATTQVRAHSNHVSPVSLEKTLSLSNNRASNESTPSPDDALWRSFVNGENLGVYHRPLSSHFHMQLPDLISKKCITPDLRQNDSDLKRTVVVSRHSSAEKLFGLVIRQGLKKGQPVLFVEGADFISGDQLLSVNSVYVADQDKDTVIKILEDIKDDDAVELLVVSSDECSEISKRFLSKEPSDVSSNKMRWSTSKYLRADKAKTEEEIASEQAFLEAEHIWLVHKEGFAAARKLNSDVPEPSLEGKIRVQLDYNQDIIEVEEDDIEKANPSKYDTVEDLAQLRFLNESSVLHTLRQRFGRHLIHTYAGPTILAFNPMAPLDTYSEKVMNMFKECRLEDMPPHIYAVSNSAYRSMIRTKKDQSIIFIGRSGSGKTSNLKHTLSFMVSMSTGSKSSKKQGLSLLTQDKTAAMFLLLEAFGNSRTIMNANATRFTKLISLEFDIGGQIVSASVQAFMLEKTRVVRRPEGEPNFNIFYLMLSGLDPQIKRELNLESLSDPNLFMTPLQRVEDKAKASAAWAHIISALKTLGITSQESNALWSVLGAIYHLGVASVSRGNMGKTQFARPQAAQRAAQCLGTTVEELARTIFQGTSSSTTLNRKLRSSDRESMNLPDGIESLESFVVNLYHEVFHTVIFLINRSISTASLRAKSTVMLLDTPGFQNPATCGRLSGATFEELCHNYVQERLQLMFHDRTITNLHDKYLQEQVDCDMGDIEELSTPAPLISLIDKQPGVRYSQNDLSSADRRGLFWLLDEEAIFPGATDESFIERLLLQNTQQGSQLLIKKGPSEKQFLLHHFQGTNPVLYNTDGWLQASRDDGSMRAAAILLHESGNKNISDLFYTSRGPVSISVAGSVVGTEGSYALRRASSIRRAFTSGGQAGMKRNSIGLQMKFQVDGLLEQLRRSKSHFVHCFLPQHNAGLCDVKDNISVTRNSTQSHGNFLLNVPLVRSQLRGAQILDAVRLHKNGFPESMTYGDFWRRYRILSEDEALQKSFPGQNELSTSVKGLLQELNLDELCVRLGNTQVFLRSGIMAHLDDEREIKLTDQVIQLQAFCRGFLARRHAHKLKIQGIALRCIQKNVRKFMGVRQWPWWRLLIKITPMLNVHRTEDELKQRTDELEVLRARSEKTEKERIELKAANERLESRLSEVTSDLAEEHSTALLASERLEAEQAERMRLEKVNADLELQNRQLRSAGERIEMELMYTRSINMNETGADFSDSEGDSSIYKHKYERAKKELQVAERRLQQQHEDDMEQLLVMKKQLEKKLSDAYQEIEDQRQTVAQWKRKALKIQGEMHDSKLLLEEQTSRNGLLEKRQRKFDAEIGLMQEDRKADAAQREKLQKELEAIKIVKYQLEDELQNLKMDLDYKETQIENLTRELDDFQTGGATEEEIASLKRQKHELELKLKDEEEVIDDLSGQVQMLEQSKIKLEMSTAAMLKDHKRELASKDEEVEQVRAAFQKKLKIVEQQLESEHEERLNFLREKREQEAKIMSLQELAARSTDEEQVYKLRRDLKRTKALLRDAQLMLEKSTSDSSYKVVIRQLKNQLEDVEFAKIAAVKAKQNIELELSDVQAQLDDILRSKSETDEHINKLSREKTDLSSQLDDTEEELQEIMKKYKATVSQLSIDQITIQEQANRILDFEEERNKLKEQNSELKLRIESLEGESVLSAQQNRLEMKIRELESKLELEHTTRSRMESQITRLKEGIEKINNECELHRNKEMATQDMSRKLQRQLRELREDYATLQQKETEANAKKNELEKQLELAEAETVMARSDLKLAMKRIEDLQTAMNGELDSESDSLPSDIDSESSENEMDNYLHSSRKVTLDHDLVERVPDLSSTAKALETTTEDDKF